MQLVGQVKKLGEDSKVAIRNERRDANKSLDSAQSDQKLSDDEIKGPNSNAAAAAEYREAFDLVDVATFLGKVEPTWLGIPGHDKYSDHIWALAAFLSWSPVFRWQWRLLCCSG